MKYLILVMLSVSSISQAGTNRCLQYHLSKQSNKIPKADITKAVDYVTRKYMVPREGIDLMVSIMLHESGFDPKVISKKGAIGLMQLMPDAITDAKSACQLSKDYSPNVLSQNVELGLCYMVWLVSTYGMMDLEETVIGYNGGVRALLNHRKGLPIPEETRVYTKRVIETFVDCQIDINNYNKL